LLHKYAFFKLKGIVVSIYWPSCCSIPVLFFLVEHKRRFWRMLVIKLLMAAISSKPIISH